MWEVISVHGTKKKKLGVKMETPLSLKGDTWVAVVLYGQTDYTVLLFSLTFNSILPAKASWPSQINPHPSCTFHLLHPPLHPSHLPSCRSQVLQDADVQSGMLSARSKIHLYQWLFSSDSAPSAHLPPVLGCGHLRSPWVMVMFQLFLN